jgi:hypothetical protein
MRYVLGLLIALFSAGPARAYDDLILPSVAFSATAVHEVGAMRDVATLRYADGKLRIDRGNGFSTTVLDLRTQTEVVLMANRTYLVLPMDDELFRRFIARVPDASGAEKVGTERIDGLETTEYEFGEDGALAAAGDYWLTATGIMVRRVWADGVLGQNLRHRAFLTDIKIEPQPEALFRIPAGYRRAK